MAKESKYNNPAIEGIPDDEPIFIIRAQDKAAIDTIDNYIDNAEFAGADEEFLQSVDEAKAGFLNWQAEHDTKTPD